MPSSGQLTDTGERMIPEFHKGTLIYGEHLTRYISAEPFIKNKTILDIASGSGYGSKLMSQFAQKVYGVDIDEDAVAYAKKWFGAPNIEYKLGDGEKIPLPDDSVDVVITFETIEHIKNYKQFIKEAKRILKPDGTIIISTPNDIEFAEGNHFHIHEFTYKELYDIVKAEFRHVDSYYQGTWRYVGLGRKELFDTEGEVLVKTLNLSPLKPEQYLYFYLVCSDVNIESKVQALGAMSGHYSERQEQEIRNKIIADNDRLKNLIEASNTITDKLKLELEHTTGHLKDIEQEILDIKSSRTYRIASIARNAKIRATKLGRRK